MSGLMKTELKADIYHPKNSLLKGLVKYFWVLRSDRRETLNHKLLPVDNVDLVLNFASPAKYVSGGREEATPRYSFCGIQNQYRTTKQSGKFNMFGVSFFSAGLYPLLKAPLSEYENRTIDFNAEVPGFNSMLEHRFNPEGVASEQVAILEERLLRLIDPQSVPGKNTLGLINAFNAGRDTQTIRSFCETHGISQRKLERIFQKHVGTAPKAFKRLHRFQMIVNRLLKRDVVDFSSLAYEHGYFDQAHFINDFKSFAGSSPKRFVEEKLSVRQIMQR